MKLCIKRYLDELKETLNDGIIFEKKLDKNIFLCVLEILYNVCRKSGKCRKWLSKSSLKGLKDEKLMLRYLLNKDKKIGKRKKKFLKSNSDFKILVNTILKDFFENCVLE